MSGLLHHLVNDDDTIRVEPPRASLGELQLTNRLQMVRIDRDVLGVAESLRKIDPGLVLDYDKNVKVYVLSWEGMRDGDVVQDLVGAYKELDQRIVKLIERIDAQGRGRHDLQTELEKLEREKDREEERRQAETIGPIAERMRHSLRRDLGAEGSSVQMSGSRGARQGRKDRERRKRRGR